MISSGIKRGLAATAVSALAIAGVPLLADSASAVSLSNSVATADSVDLLLANTAVLSAKNDGTNSTVRLTALGGANVTSVKFEYSLGGGVFQNIGTATRTDNGAFPIEWDPTAIAGAPAVTIRATPVGPTTPVADQATGVTLNNTTNSVNVTDGTGIGVFQQVYTGATAQDVIVSGTASAPASTPALTYWDSSAQAFQGSGTGVSTSATGATTGTWTGILDITGYDYGTGDELLVRAVDGSDDTEAFGLYKQTITTVTASADRTTVPAGASAAVTVTVNDQNGKPIAGAEVRSSNGGAAQYTNEKGQASFTQNAGSASYYANATDSDPYEAGLGDKQSDTITVTAYNATPTTLAATSADGAAFDVDEYTSGDITVRITDQNGNPINEAGRTVQYYWVETPFDGSPATQRFPATGNTIPAAVTDVNGRAVVEFPTGQTDPNGSYDLFVSLDADTLGNGAIASTKALTVKAGEAALTYDAGTPEQAAAGSTEPVTGKLALTDGTGLPGRQVAFTFNRGATGTDAVKDAFLLGTDGTTPVANNTASNRTTSATGTFSISVKDPAETPQGTELGGLVTAAVTGNADANPAAQGVDFVASVTPGVVNITDNSGGVVKPGQVANFTVEVRTGDTDSTTPGVQDSAISNQSVTLTLDHGYFTDGTPATTPAIGGDAGDFKVLGTDGGKTLTVTTGSAGTATVQVAIARDAGFDDDGMVTSTLSAKAGDVTKTQTHTWNSANPINGGEVKIVESPEDRQNGPTDPSPLTNDIVYDVFTTDQFGNLVGGETVNLNIDDTDADVSNNSVTSDFDDRGEFTVSADRAGTYEVTGTWLTDTYKYTTAVGTGTPVTAVNGETVTGSADAEFYAVDFTAATFTLTSNPEGDVPVGSAVTETVKVVDQEGNPVPNLSVQWLQNGPGDASVSQPSQTNANGEAFYTFVGAKAGTANITAVVSDSEQVKTLSDSVTFKNAGPVGIGLKLTGSNNGKKADKLTANANNNAAGLKAVLYKNGKKVASHALGASGNYTFTVKDTNGAKATKYTVKVAATATTKSGQASKSVK